MSFGLALAQGLIGGFTKNIEREQDARISDDQRMADLQDMWFQGTIKSAQDGTPMPKQIGDKLQQAKLDMEDSRKKNPIGAFGMGKADRLNLTMADLSGTLNGVGSNNETYGKLVFPMNKKYGTSTGSASFIVNAGFYLKDINDNLRTRDMVKVKEYLKNNPTIASNFKKDIVKNFSRLSQGLPKSFVADGMPTTTVYDPKVDYPNIASILDDQTIGIAKTETTTELSFKAAKQRLLEDKNDSSFNNSNSIVVPVQFDDRIDFIGLKLKPENLKAAKEIANKFNYGDNVGLFIYDMKKKFETLDTLPTSDTITTGTNSTSFPTFMHAVQLWKRGGGKSFENMSQAERDSITKYTNDEFGFDTEQKVKALAPLMTVPDEQMAKFQNMYSAYTLVASDVNKSREKTFLNLVGVKPTEFTTKFQANMRTLDGLDKLTIKEAKERTAPGVVRVIKSVFGGIVAKTGAWDQVTELIMGSSKKDDGSYDYGNGLLHDGTTGKEAVTKASIKKVLDKVKAEQGLASELGNISEIESLMIVIAADMARAIDPSGRLSNQDFEVQLKRLGKSGWFNTKLGAVGVLDQVRTDFSDRFERIKMIQAVNIGTSRSGTFTKGQLQILYANKVVNGLKDLELGIPAEVGTGFPIFNSENSWVDNFVEGPEGQKITIYEDPNGIQRYFINNPDGNLVEINENQIIEKSLNQQENKNNLSTEKKPEVKKEKPEVKTEKPNAELETIITGGNGRIGFTLEQKQADGTIKRLPGRYTQNKETNQFEPFVAK
tara:strand:+ start:2134 stop:4452 length:2319 start_codon:yes stop_codon:yes gene_type:complete